MSYDYLLVRGEPDPEMAALLGEMEGEEAALMGIWGAAMSNAIGSVDEVKDALSRLFSHVKWEKSSAKLPPNIAKTSPIADWSWGALGGPEFTLGSDESGQVRAISMCYAERAQVEQVAGVMGLRALDEQSLEVFGG